MCECVSDRGWGEGERQKMKSHLRGSEGVGRRLSKLVKFLIPLEIIHGLKKKIQVNNFNLFSSLISERFKLGLCMSLKEQKQLPKLDEDELVKSTDGAE